MNEELYMMIDQLGRYISNMESNIDELLYFSNEYAYFLDSPEAHADAQIIHENAERIMIEIEKLVENAKSLSKRYR